MKRLFGVVAASLLIITFIGGFLLINNPTPQTVARKSAAKKKKIAATSGLSKSIWSHNENKMPALPESRRAEAIAKFKIIYPAKILGSGPPKIYAPSLNMGLNPDGKTTPYDMIGLEYPNGLRLIRSYRDANDPTIHNYKAVVEQSKKNPFHGGITWQLADINGHEALAREKSHDKWSDKSIRKYYVDKTYLGATIVWYVKPFLYELYGPVNEPLAKMLPIARRFTTLVGASPLPGSQNIDIGD